MMGFENTHFDLFNFCQHLAGQKNKLLAFELGLVNEKPTKLQGEGSMGCQRPTHELGCLRDIICICERWLIPW